MTEPNPDDAQDIAKLTRDRCIFQLRVSYAAMGLQPALPIAYIYGGFMTPPPPTALVRRERSRE